jgi:hypothetical protein
VAGIGGRIWIVGAGHVEKYMREVGFRANRKASLILYCDL